MLERNIMKLKPWLFLAMAALMTLSGCASVRMAPHENDKLAKQFNSPPVGKSGLYIYRDSFCGQASKKAVYMDGVAVGETANKVYFYITISPGSHSLSTESEFSNNSSTFVAVGGKNYFARQKVRMGVFLPGASINLVTESIGKAGVLDCELAE